MADFAIKFFPIGLLPLISFLIGYMALTRGRSFTELVADVESVRALVLLYQLILIGAALESAIVVGAIVWFVRFNLRQRRTRE